MGNYPESRPWQDVPGQWQGHEVLPPCYQPDETTLEPALEVLPQGEQA